MKVCLLSKSDRQGGASISAYRLHQGLQNLQVDSTMIVGDQSSDDYTILSPQSKVAKGWAKFTPSLDALPLLLYPQRQSTVYDLQWLPDRIAAQVREIAPDIISLHWINAGYLQIETLAKLKQPMIWTLHDMWPFTGGCHYSQECDRYRQTCGACPQLHSQRELDLSRWIWWRKSRAWKDLNLTLVSPSHWLAQCARSSSLFKDFRVEVIHHGIDITKYKPVEPKLARELLGLPQDKKLVLFGAVHGTKDPRKGFHLLQHSLQKLSYTEWQEKLEIVIFGASKPQNPPQLGFECHYLGQLNDDLSLVLAYSAADVMIVPSSQESFGQTALESLACGTPVVAFNTTGLKDIIEHQHDGYLAQPFEIEDLTRGITWVLEANEKERRLSDRAREKVEKQFSLDMQARCYLSLFMELSTPA